MNDLKKRRLQVGLKQKDVAEFLGVGKSTVSMYENGKREISSEMMKKIDYLFNDVMPQNGVFEAKFDYFRIRFPTKDYKMIIKGVLKMNYDAFLHVNRGLYGYAETYFFGEIRVMVSDKDNLGVLIQLSGEGCRNLDDVLDSLNETWHDFVARCLDFKGSATRIDVALDDYEEVMTIPEMARKIRQDLYDSDFLTYEIIDSGNTKYNDSEGMTIYFGSKRSLIYFCFYQKNYEQAKKLNIPLEDVDVKNRYEIRMVNEKAKKFLEEYLKVLDFGNAICGIMASYVEFRDYMRYSKTIRISTKWLKLIGECEKIDLKLFPKKPTLQSKINWIRAQVAKTLKIIQEVDLRNGTNILSDVIEEALLEKNDKKMIEIATGLTEEFTFEAYGQSLLKEELEELAYLASVIEIAGEKV